MDLLNKKVKHAIFGVGTVTEFSDKYITIQFAEKTSKFVYPDAFEKFLKAEDSAVHEVILNNIAAAKQAEEEKHQEELAARKAEEDKRLAEEAEKRLKSSQRTGNKLKPAVKSQRIEGKPMTFLVFQSKVFDEELHGGYIWAPISSASGTKFHHWTRLLDIRKDDIIIHGCDRDIKAISVARDVCYDCTNPTELKDEDLWKRDGRRVDCDYIKIDNPINTTNFTEDIIRLCQIKYSPFDKNGNNNTGYLYEINRELAKIFIEASVKQNPNLASVEYINQLLTEENKDE